MTYETIVSTLLTMNDAITGVEDAFDYEPSVPKITPVIYTVLDDMRIEKATLNTRRKQYNIFLRLLLSYTDNEECEELLTKFVDRIEAAYAEGNTLDAALDGGWCRLRDGNARYVSIGNAVYRRLEYRIEVVTVE